MEHGLLMLSFYRSEYNQESEQFLIIMTESIRVQLLSYRNGYYQGQTKSQYRHGHGIMIRDDGAIIVGLWKNDLIFGRAFVFVNSEEYCYVEFNRGELDGNCYFRSDKEMLVGQFRSGRPIDRQLLVDFPEGKIKVIAFRNASYETLQEFKLQEDREDAIVEKYLGPKMYLPPLIQYLQSELCNNSQGFELLYLQNGNTFFRYRQKGNPHSLGFIVGKKSQLISYGLYLEEKLHYYGCKFQSSGRYEGQFQAGQLNGYGMLFSDGRYSFGRFEAGKLIQPLHLDERTNESEAKLRELKKKIHIQSTFFYNNYISREIMKFKGISEVTSLSSYLKGFLYEQSKPNIQLTSSNLKGSNVSLNQILGSRVQPREEDLMRSVFQSSHVSQPHQPLEWERPREDNNGNSERGRFLGV